MKKTFLTLLICFSAMAQYAQKISPKDEAGIKAAIEAWNTASAAASTDQMMSLFDDSDNIMLIGSAKGEIYKGKEQIRTWLSQLYGFAGFSWEMNRMDIDLHGNTAWVFVEGSMVLKFHKGGSRKAPYRFTGILVRNKGAWRWRLFNGSSPQQE